MRIRSTHVEDRPVVDDPRYDDPAYRRADDLRDDDPAYYDHADDYQRYADGSLPPPSTATAPPVATVRDPEAPVNPAVYDDRAVVTDTVTYRRFSPASVIGAIGGLALVVIGVVALTHAGTAALDRPVVTVAGFDHTAVLGIVEIVAGGLMLLAAASRSRGALFLISLIICGAAIAAAIEPSIGGDSTAIESTFAVIVAIGAGIVALLAAMLSNVSTARGRTAVH